MGKVGKGEKVDIWMMLMMLLMLMGACGVGIIMRHQCDLSICDISVCAMVMIDIEYC